MELPLCDVDLQATDPKRVPNCKRSKKKLTMHSQFMLNTDLDGFQSESHGSAESEFAKSWRYPG